MKGGAGGVLLDPDSSSLPAMLASWLLLKHAELIRTTCSLRSCSLYPNAPTLV